MFLRCLVLSLGLLPAALAAQEEEPPPALPEHEPGAICITPAGWCWAENRGTPGAPCGCATNDGYVPGKLG